MGGWEWKRPKNKFNYPEVVGNHFLYQHSVDDNNNKRHSPISLEDVWATKYWPNLVFSFLPSVTKVNVNLAATYFSGQEPTGQINFRKKLAKTLIFNTHYNEDNDKTPDKKRKQQEYGHVSSRYPRAKTFPEHESLQQTVNIRSTNAIHAKKGTYLLPMFPRSLPVCRMFRLSSCMNLKQSFNTRLNSVAQNRKKWHAKDHQ